MIIERCASPHGASSLACELGQHESACIGFCWGVAALTNHPPASRVGLPEYCSLAPISAATPRSSACAFTVFWAVPTSPDAVISQLSPPCPSHSSTSDSISTMEGASTLGFCVLRPSQRPPMP
eukprot:scaffold11091_cov75-Phaeocystis_antarctica.AAC.3